MRPALLMGSLSVLVALVVFATEAQGRQLLQDCECSPPPDGLWEAVTTLQLPDTGTRVTVVQSRVNLTQGLENAYIGQGSGTAFFDPEGNPATIPLSFSFLAVFSRDTCVMAATIYSFEDGFIDAVYWQYDGDKMRGGSMGAANGTFVFPEVSQMEVSFIE